MNQDTSKLVKPIRLVFELERADNVRLYDELMRFKKGAKRVNRLRVLAHEGLLAQHWPIGVVRHELRGEIEAPPPEVRGGPVINKMFDEPIAE